jgi:esterase/lipase
MSFLAVKATKWLEEIGARLVKAQVRFHGIEAIQEDMAILFVTDRFLRLETLLLPYEIRKRLGKEVRSLVPGDLFTGRIGAFLRSNGMTSSENSEPNLDIVRSLLEGDSCWLVFLREPTPYKKASALRCSPVGTPQFLADAGHRLSDMNPAAMALRAEYYRRHIRRLLESGDQEQLNTVLRQLGLSSPEKTLARRTIIIPIRVTYFPVRPRENLFLCFACAVARDPSRRAIEDLSAEGTVLAQGADIDIAVGSPVDVTLAMHAPEYRGLLACAPEDFRRMEQDPASVLHHPVHELTRSWTRSLSNLTTISSDHVLAALMRYQWGFSFREWALRARLFLCAQRIPGMHCGPCHPELATVGRDAVREDPNPRFDDFMTFCKREGIIEERGGEYRRNALTEKGARLSRIVSEIEPLTPLMNLIRRIAWTPTFLNAYFIRRMLVDEQRRAFDREYAAHYEAGVSKPPDVGRPFLLKPLRPVRGGIVLIHGYMAAPLEVRLMAEHLRRNGYAVYGVRLKGHGTSPADLALTTWQDWYESVQSGLAIVRTISENVIVGGFSMGAGLALLVAGRKPFRIRAAFAIDTPLHVRSAAARFAPSIVKVNALLKRFRWGRSRWEYVENDPENKDINYLSNPVSGVAELTKAMNVMLETLKDITAPTLIIQGARDPVVHPDSAPTIFERVGTPHKELVILERDRHGIINGPGSKDVFDHVGRFLARARSSSRTRG